VKATESAAARRGSRGRTAARCTAIALEFVLYDAVSRYMLGSDL
jgi:hypothetical protein